MIQIVKADERHFSDMGWLQTYWLFSFGDYFAPENVQHGALRVFNDDIVQPLNGFASHPHEEMEIISIILAGEMTHKDSMGNECVLRPGDVQRMTAGTGLFHSEWNNSREEVSFFQIWIKPDTKGLPPSYDQIHFSEDSWFNRLTLLATGQNVQGVVELNTDASLFRSKLEGQRTVCHTTTGERHLFLYVVEGGTKVNGKTLGSRDQARISQVETVEITAADDTDFILIDIPGA